MNSLRLCGELCGESGSDYATNNSMELHAILGGIAALEGPHEVLVKTDSQVARRYLTGLKSAGQPHLHEITDEIRAVVHEKGHKVMVQKAKDNEVWRAHALAQMEKRESAPMPMQL